MNACLNVTSYFGGTLKLGKTPAIWHSILTLVLNTSKAAFNKMGIYLKSEEIQAHGLLDLDDDRASLLNLDNAFQQQGPTQTLEAGLS